jgi:hypothetical protein
VNLASEISQPIGRHVIGVRPVRVCRRMMDERSCRMTVCQCSAGHGRGDRAWPAVARAVHSHLAFAFSIPQVQRPTLSVLHSDRHRRFWLRSRICRRRIWRGFGHRRRLWCGNWLRLRLRWLRYPRHLECADARLTPEEPLRLLLWQSTCIVSTSTLRSVQEGVVGCLNRRP